MLEQVIKLLSGISLYEAINHIILIVGIISAIVEKSNKLPFNPWSKLFEWFGSKINRHLYDKIELLEKEHKDTKDLIVEMRKEYKESSEEIKKDYNNRVDKLERDIDNKEAKRLRSNIICFSDSCRVNNKHTKNHFENIFRDYDDYIHYCTIHNFENHYIEGEMKYIEGIYYECLKENKFL